MSNEKDNFHEMQSVIDRIFWENVSKNSKTVSDICRALAFGIGGILIAFGKSPLGFNFSRTDVFIFFILVLYFIFDALQYFSLMIKYEWQAKDYEIKINNGVVKCKHEIVRESQLNYPAEYFFYIKFALLALATLLLFGLFYCRFSN